MKRTEREARWAETMAGHGDSFQTAHADSNARIGASDPATRAEREEQQDQLAPSATHGWGAGSRAIAEEPDQYRTCFERDRDRIVHGSAFRRLAGKTQVFVFPDDHQRTRLTHALEVAQVAVSIARSLRLNVALTEAIALGHDCGHGPFGHASEDAFAPFIPGGYDHTTWGADVVLPSLNLCEETLDGIRNHSWSRPAPATPEGEVVSWADRIAYLCHDFEDAVDAGVVTPDDLPDMVARLCGRTRREQLGELIRGLVESSAAEGRICMRSDLATALAAFRQFNYDEIYLRPESMRQARVVVEVLGALVEYYVVNERLLEAAGRAVGDPVVDAVTFVAGMTDRYAIDRAIEYLDWNADALPRGL